LSLVSKASERKVSVGSERADDVSTSRVPNHKTGDSDVRRGGGEDLKASADETSAQIFQGCCDGKGSMEGQPEGTEEADR
jgi:hypothetical protein